MVLAIIGIVTIVAMPSLVKSIRGNRLRMGARAVVMAGTYAHKMAILRNQEMKLVLDREGNRITVEQLRQAPAARPSDQDFADASPPSDSNSATNAPSPGTALPPVNLTRTLDAVRLDSVTVNRKKENSNDSIIYQTNGRCTPYEVKVVDEYGGIMIITVDAVASVKVRQESE